MPENEIPAHVCGLPTTGAKAYFILTGPSARGGSLLFVAEREESLSDFQNALASLAGIPGLKTDFECLVFGEDPWSRSIAVEKLRSRASGKTRSGAGSLIILATAGALKEKILSAGDFSGLRMELKAGKAYKRAWLLSGLEKAGYERTEFVESPGEYAVRGSIIDIFCLDPMKPVRLFFSGDALESARFFDVSTQRTADFTESVTVLPVKMQGGGILKELLPVDLACLVDEEVPAESLSGENSLGPYLPEKFSMVTKLNPGIPGTLDFGASAGMHYGADTELVEKEVKRLREAGSRSVIFCLNKGEQERLVELFADTAVPDLCEFVIGKIQDGFYHPGTKLAVITSGEILNRSYRPAMSWKYRDPGAKRYKWSDLKTGDYVVHEDYGIGRYLGLEKISGAAKEPDTADQEDIDCLRIEYKGGDKLFVPLYEFKKVQKYIGSEGKAPRLSSMDTKRWQEVKNRVKKGIEEVAKDILRIEAQRALVRGFSFGGPSHLEGELADSFPFEETPDQLAAINSVLGDMSGTKPMDRIVVGDVGFGKTEVAMRAAMKCAVGGKQTAVLVPTTILADQHFRTFSERFSGFPVNIAMLSRFQTPGEQKKIIRDISLGAVDIVIGTHRLLQKDIKFKDLGLMVADEEHRFGVKDKEKLKAMARGVHILTLSATPIPRTLYQSISTLRDISVIESPPVGRLPISTFVLPWNQDTAVSAIREELSRGGQVFYVHNRVTTLPARLAFLKSLLPDVRFALAHGQMNADRLEETMWDFFHKKYDVLLASTIIESGLDIPSVNTLLVENAHEFGLSQLYQLRGRIGRERQKAFSYLFYPRWLKAPRAPEKKSSADYEEERDDQKGMSENAEKRLAALQEFGELGSGFRLAMRDLEIRGAGELLGVRQHGFLNEIGIGLYCELLTAEINKLKGKAGPEEETPAVVDIKVSAFIPEDYLPDELERLNYYKKLLNAVPGNIGTVLAEIEDLCGPAPEPVKAIVRLISLRKIVSTLGIRQLHQTETHMEIFFRPKTHIPPAAIAEWQKEFGDRLEFLPNKSGDGLKIAGPITSPFDFIEDFIEPLNGKLQTVPSHPSPDTR